ncbi:unnamed protein product, partial [Musa acuminata subsp. burmannicoides]
RTERGFSIYEYLNSCFKSRLHILLLSLSSLSLSLTLFPPPSSSRPPPLDLVPGRPLSIRRSRGSS